MFFYSLSVLHGVTDTCSFLDAPFFTAKVFFLGGGGGGGGGGITNFCQLSRLTVVSRAAKKLQSARPIKRRAATTVSYLRVGPISQY